jgi:hypothetical protein
MQTTEFERLLTTIVAWRHCIQFHIHNPMKFQAHYRRGLVDRTPLNRITTGPGILRTVVKGILWIKQKYVHKYDMKQIYLFPAPVHTTIPSYVWVLAGSSHMTQTEKYTTQDYPVKATASHDIYECQIGNCHYIIMQYHRVNIHRIVSQNSWQPQKD